MKPYYEDDYVTIFHGDSREIIPSLGSFDLTLSDPPYGINGGRGGTSKARGRGNYEGAFTSDDDTPDFIRNVSVPIISHCISISRSVIITPGNKNFCYYPQPVSFGCFWQPASGGAQRHGWADSQPIFYYGESPTQGKSLSACSFELRGSDETKNGHPCPKPFKIWFQLLRKGMGDWTGRVLDPFMGSGTTLRAAKDYGRKAVGIEIEEKWCEIAAERMRQEVFAL